MNIFLRSVLSIAFSVAPFFVFAQKNDSLKTQEKSLSYAKDSSEIFAYVEQMPSFNGDMTAYIKNNTKYPDAAREAKVKGRVFVQFIVNKDGALSEVIVLKGIGAGCDEEAVRMIKGMPLWRPAKQNGKTVRVRVTLPISFP